MVPLHSPLAMQDCYDCTWLWSGDEVMHHNKFWILQILGSMFLSPEHWLCLSTLLSLPLFFPRRSCLAASSSDIVAYTSKKHRETRPPVQVWMRVWQIALVRSCHIHAKKATWQSSRNSVQCRKRICTDTLMDIKSWQFFLGVPGPIKLDSKARKLISDQGDFWAQSVEILVFASPTGYMLTSSGFPLLNWGIFYKFL